MMTHKPLQVSLDFDIFLVLILGHEEFLSLLARYRYRYNLFMLKISNSWAIKSLYA